MAGGRFLRVLSVHSFTGTASPSKSRLQTWKRCRRRHRLTPTAMPTRASSQSPSSASRSWCARTACNVQTLRFPRSRPCAPSRTFACAAASLTDRTAFSAPPSARGADLRRPSAMAGLVRCVSSAAACKPASRFGALCAPTHPHSWLPWSIAACRARAPAPACAAAAAGVHERQVGGKGEPQKPSCHCSPRLSREGL